MFRKKIRRIFHDTWKSDFSVHKVLLERRLTCLCIVCGCFCKSWTVATDVLCPIKPKIFTIFMEKDYWPWPRGVIFMMPFFNSVYLFKLVYWRNRETTWHYWSMVIWESYGHCCRFHVPWGPLSCFVWPSSGTCAFCGLHRQLLQRLPLGSWSSFADLGRSRGAQAFQLLQAGPWPKCKDTNLMILPRVMRTKLWRVTTIPLVSFRLRQNHTSSQFLALLCPI